MSIKQLAGGPPAAPRPDRPAVSVKAEAAPAAHAVALPAVSVKVSDVAAGTLVAALAETPFTDRELLNTLKQRIQSGDFKIDYASLAQSLVDDAVQAIGSRRGAPR
jgi:anti-sigma28 factor (negative regulator of flagellin synthesis)